MIIHSDGYKKLNTKKTQKLSDFFFLMLLDQI